MSKPRLLTLLLAWLLLALSAQRLAPGPSFFLAPAPATLVLVVPWLASLAAFEPRAVLGALRDGFDERPMDLPQERRERSRRILRGLAGLSIATGALATLAAAVGLLQELALATQPDAPEQRVLGALGSMLLAPAYGVALADFFYAPRAGACEEREGLEEVG